MKLLGQDQATMETMESGVEIRVRPKSKAEERPKPVLDSLELGKLFQLEII
jgi:hypothetical protein